MKLSEHFTLEELTSSATARRYNIPNNPTPEVVEKLRSLCLKVLEPLRQRYGKPVIVSSGYRSVNLNIKVGGVSTSQHIYGEAADIRSVSDSKEDNKEIFDILKQMIRDEEICVGQLINEYDYNWVHVSLPNKKHKNEIIAVV